jgi:hypothetical protein
VLTKKETMDKLDDIKEKYGNKTPFSVPENYFEQFTDKMMAQLPEKAVNKKSDISIWVKIRPIIYLAAMFSAAIWSINLYQGKHSLGAPAFSSKSANQVKDADSEAVTFAMSVDDYALYEYLNEEKTN